MAITDDEYYQPVSTTETSALDPFSVRTIHDMAAALSNYQRYAGAFPLLCEWCIPHLSSGLTSVTDETVILRWPAILVPDGFTHLSWDLGHYQVTGVDAVVWTLYCTEELYVGPDALDTSLLPAEYGSATITTTGGAVHDVENNQDCEIHRSDGGVVYLMLTATNTSGSNAAATTIDVAPIMA